MSVEYTLGTSTTTAQKARVSKFFIIREGWGRFDYIYVKDKESIDFLEKTDNLSQNDLRKIWSKNCY